MGLYLRFLRVEPWWGMRVLPRSLARLLLEGAPLAFRPTARPRPHNPAQRVMSERSPKGAATNSYETVGMWRRGLLLLPIDNKATLYQLKTWQKSLTFRFKLLRDSP